MNTQFISNFASDLDAFIAFKRALGYAYDESTVYYLRIFDRYCADGGFSVLSKELVDGWLDIERRRRSASNTFSQLSLIRQFARYLYANGDTSAYILPARYRQRQRSATPYLLSEDEIKAFFRACNVYKSRQYGLIRKTVYASLFQTLHACGLRPCEARRLTCNNVDLKAATIDIIDSKGPKSRRLYLSDELRNYLYSYNQRIANAFADRQAFFPTAGGGFLSSNSVCRTFNRIWDAAGLMRPEKGSRPCPYSFRHHFAFANIARWMKQEHDVASMMPYLMRFMGHSSLQSTYYYINISPDMLADIAATAHPLEILLPEVLCDD